MNTTKIIAFLLFLMLSRNVRGQIVQFDWAAKFGGASQEIGFSVAVGSLGHVYSGGFFQDTADFDPSPYVHNLSPGINAYTYLSKLTPEGNFVWVNTVGGTRVEDIVLDQYENIYVTGWFYDTVDFDPGPAVLEFIAGSANDPDAYVAKYDSSGQFLWAKKFGGGFTDKGTTIAVDTFGNVYSSGLFSLTVDFDPGIGTLNYTSAGLWDIYIVKLNPAGDLVWAKRMGGGANDDPYEIAVDLSGNVYTTGEFALTADFDPGTSTYNLTSLGNWDIFISKLNASGNFVWAKRIGGGDADRGNSIAVDVQGNVFSTGRFNANNGSIDFDPGAGVYNVAPFDVGTYFLKLNANGGFAWAKYLVGQSLILPTAVALDDSSHAYFAGSFDASNDFNPSPTSTFPMASMGGNDGFILKLDSTGSFRWAKRNGGTITDGIYDIQVDQNFSVYTTGYFQGTADFDPSTTQTYNLYAIGAEDAFVQKLLQCFPSSYSFSDTACGSYLLNGQTYTTSGTHTQVLTNSRGCDSTLTLHLILQNTAATLTLPAVCDTTVEVNGQTYISTGTYLQTLTNAVGCDSLLTVNVFIGNSSSGSLNADTCNSYPLNGIIYTSSGIYTQHLTNVTGCDSTLILNLTVHLATSASLNIIACNSYFINGHTYTVGGTYIEHMQNQWGCDSTVTLALTILPLSSVTTLSGQTLTATQSGIQYQWLDCNNSYSAISGATLQSFTPSASGSYAVMVTNGGCIDTSSCTTITVVSTQQSFLSEVTIFPNPNIGKFSLDLSQLSPWSVYKVSVLNGLGQCIVSDRFIGGQVVPWDLKSIAGGIYWIKIEGYDSVIIKRFLVEKP